MPGKKFGAFHNRGELDFSIERLINSTQSGEGSNLPPRLVGNRRVPRVRNLQIVKVTPVFDGTEFTLLWANPENSEATISQYNVYARGILGNPEPVFMGGTQKSPVVVRISTNQVERITFFVQTQLASGQVTILSESPAVTGVVELTTIPSGSYGTNTIPLTAIQNGTPGQLITWGALGPITTIGPGAADNILVGAGAGAVPLFKSRTTLDLVEGRSNLTTAGRVVSVSSAGIVTQSAFATSDFVAGAPNLTDAGAVPFVLSSGTLTDNPTNFFWNNSTLSLGIGTNAPTARLHLPAGATGAGLAPLKITSGSLLTTPEAGTFEYDGKKYYVTPTSTRRVIDITSDTKTSDTTVANTVTATSIYSAVLVANTPAVGQIYRVRVFGYYSTANATDTFTLRFFIGATEVIAIVSAGKSVTNTPFDVEFAVTIRTIGGTGTVMAYADGQFDKILVSTSDTSTTTVDTTTNNTLDVTVQWSNALAGNTLTCTQAFFQIRG